LHLSSENPVSIFFAFQIRLLHRYNMAMVHSGRMGKQSRAEAEAWRWHAAAVVDVEAADAASAAVAKYLGAHNYPKHLTNYPNDVITTQITS
jgi:hypothetical protein